MELDILSIKIRWYNIRIVTGITVLSLFLFAGSVAAYPPPAILKIDGNEQTSGIGSNCWREENQTVQTCSDTFGIITPFEPLLTRSPFTAHIRLPLQEPPAEVGFSTTPVTDDDEFKELTNDVRVWRLGSGWNWNNLPSERESDINLSLEPGLYVLNVGAKWKEKGSTTYGFLVQVYDPEAKITNKVSSGEKVAGFEIFLAITTLLLVITIRRNRNK